LIQEPLVEAHIEIRVGRVVTVKQRLRHKVKVRQNTSSDKAYTGRPTCWLRKTVNQVILSEVEGADRAIYLHLVLRANKSADGCHGFRLRRTHHDFHALDAALADLREQPLFVLLPDTSADSEILVSLIPFS
jgi:hypothetical protein